MEMQEILKRTCNELCNTVMLKTKAANALSKAQTRNAKPASTVCTMQQTKDCIFSFKCRCPIKRHIQNYFKTLTCFQQTALNRNKYSFVSYVRFS